MGIQVRLWLPKRKIILVADSSYAALELLDSLLNLPNPVYTPHILTLSKESAGYMVTQLRLDAQLFEPAPERTSKTKGRPRKKGNKLPKLTEVLVDPQTNWRTVTVANWYGKGPTEVEITSGTAVWYSSGKPAVSIRWVLVRDPKGKFETRAFLCTDLPADPIQILEWFVGRWQLEVTYQEVRAHSGVETQRQWIR